MTFIRRNHTLTAPDAELDRQHAQTHAGMAHFALTGPAGKRCMDCGFWAWGGGYTKFGEPEASECQKYRQLLRQTRGCLRVPCQAAACKYFTQREKEIPRDPRR